MAQKKNDNTEYVALKQAIRNNCLENLYIFHGEERYLLEHYLREIKKNILTPDFEDFNYKRFEGKAMTIADLSAAIDALPVFADRTLIEVYDFDLFRASEEQKQQFFQIISDFPEYAHLIFVYDTIEFNLDGRVKLNNSIKILFHNVDFQLQEQSDLINWIHRHFKNQQKRIDRATAEYLAFITGGLMMNINCEIEKISAFSKSDTITKECIDAVVTPVLDAVTYKLTDALAAGNFDLSAQLLDELIQMREPPHKLLYSISLKMRQLLVARICLELGKGYHDLMEICGIRYEFQAKNLFGSARFTSAHWCKIAVIQCAETALAMNSTGENNEALLIDLLIMLAAATK